MSMLKKTVSFVTALLLCSVVSLYATSFNMGLSLGKDDSFCVGLTSIVSQQVTDKFTIESSVIYLPSDEYEAVLKTTFTITPWFNAGTGFMLFTDESSMLPALTASTAFTAGSFLIADITGCLGLNENNLKQPYLYRLSATTELNTKVSRLDLFISWQLLKPDTFNRMDVSGNIKTYATSPTNEKMKVYLGINGGLRTDSRYTEKFAVTGGLSIGFDYGTDAQGFYGGLAVNPLDTRGEKTLTSSGPWMVSAGIRFKY